MDGCLPERNGQVFAREIYKTILLDSIRHCQQSQNLKIDTYLLMTNYLHTIFSCKAGYDFGLIWRNTKSFTAMKLIDALNNNSKESRKEYLLHTFAALGKKAAVILNTSFGTLTVIRNTIVLRAAAIVSKQQAYVENYSSIE